MAKWELYKGEKAPQCTHCGMLAGFTRYRRKNGINAREMSNYCSDCGAEMTAMPDCKTCNEAVNGEWQDNGICFACRGEPWIYGKTNRIAIKYRKGVK